MKLKPLQLEILRVLAKCPPDTELLTGEIGWAVPTEVLPISCGGIRKSRPAFIFNYLGPTLGKMAKVGLVIGRRNPHPRAGEGSYWKLGPLSDKLKEDGIL